jgi:ABC-type multidrug transport system ATPase subunit
MRGHWSARTVTRCQGAGFRPEQLDVPVGDLSGSEQARVRIAQLMLQPADVLLLDEPTNDLDIPALEVLEDSLAEFPGALVIVSHDRDLLDRICTGVVGLDENRLSRAGCLPASSLFSGRAFPGAGFLRPVIFPADKPAGAVSGNGRKQAFGKTSSKCCLRNSRQRTRSIGIAHSWIAPRYAHPAEGMTTQQCQQEIAQLRAHLADPFYATVEQERQRLKASRKKNAKGSDPLRAG